MIEGNFCPLNKEKHLKPAGNSPKPYSNGQALCGAQCFLIIASSASLKMSAGLIRDMNILALRNLESERYNLSTIIFWFTMTNMIIVHIKSSYRLETYTKYIMTKHR